MPEQRLENWLDIPNSVLLFFLRSLRTSRLKMRTPGMAEDTMEATMDPRLATPEPWCGVPKNIIPAVSSRIELKRAWILASINA